MDRRKQCETSPHPFAVEWKVVQPGSTAGGLLLLEGDEAKAARGAVGEVGHHCVRHGAKLLLEERPQVVWSKHSKSGQREVERLVKQKDLSAQLLKFQYQRRCAIEILQRPKSKATIELVRPDR